MKEFFIRSILNFLFGLKPEQWRAALDAVKALALRRDITNDDRAAHFVAYFKKEWPGLKGWIIETIRNLAVAYARKKGWITP